MSPHGLADDTQPDSVADAVTAIRLDRTASNPPTKAESISDNDETKSPDDASKLKSTKMTATASVKSENPSNNGIQQSASADVDIKPKVEVDDKDIIEEKVTEDVTVKTEPGKPPKLSRSRSQKGADASPPPLFLDLPDRTAEACSTFEPMETCTYSNKYMGYTEHAMECDCAEEWGKFVFFFFFYPPLS